MKLLEEKIQKEGEVLGDDILRVDSFVSHQVDLPLMEELGKDMAEHFRGQGVTKVFTIESSGIAPAVFTARALGVPLVILKKQNAENLGTEVWQTEVVSYTKDTSYRLTLAKNYISDADHVLIVDDFLANGEAATGAVRLIRKAHATVAGVGVAISICCNLPRVKQRRYEAQEARQKLCAECLKDGTHSSSCVVDTKHRPEKCPLRKVQK